MHLIVSFYIQELLELFNVSDDQVYSEISPYIQHTHIYRLILGSCQRAESALGCEGDTICSWSVPKWSKKKDWRNWKSGKEWRPSGPLHH